MSHLPRYALNPRLLHDTIEPPVALSRAWAASFPLSRSPCPNAQLLNLAQGVPGAGPPASFTRRLTSSPIQHGYGDVFGAAKLREALARDLNSVYCEQPNVQQEDVCITAGANMAFAVVAQALAAAGDSILVPTPWYFNHYMTLTSLGITAVPVEARPPEFTVTVESVKAALETAQNAKALVLVTPNNPTGAVYLAARISELAALCTERGIALVLDETYRDFLLEGEERTRPHGLFKTSQWRDVLIHISSFSKAYAIPGHRLGGIACHPGLLRAEQFGPIAKALDNLQISPPALSTQEAVAWAVSDSEQQAWRTETAKSLRERRSAFKQMLEGISVKSGDPWRVESAGAYYAFVRHPWPQLESEHVARALAGLVGVVVLPGSFFMPATRGGAADRLRFSVANVSMQRLQELPERLRLLDEFWLQHGVGTGVD